MDHEQQRWALSAQHLGEEIRLLREQKGWQQADLAERLGVGRMTISRLERGQPVSSVTAIRAISFLGHGIALIPKGKRYTVRDAL